MSKQHWELEQEIRKLIEENSILKFSRDRRRERLEAAKAAMQGIVSDLKGTESVQ